MLFERGEILIDRFWRASEALPVTLNGFADDVGSKVHEMDHELVGMLGLDPELGQRGGGKVLQVLGHDDIGPAMNRHGQDVPVIGIWQHE